MTPSRLVFGLVVLCLVTGGSQHGNVVAAERLARYTENEELKPVMDVITPSTEAVFIVTPEKSALAVTSPRPMGRALEESTTFPGPMEREMEESTTFAGPMEREMEEFVTLSGPIDRDSGEIVTLQASSESEESTTWSEPMQRELEVESTTLELELARAAVEVEQVAATTTMSSLQEPRANQEQQISTTAMPDCDAETPVASTTSHDETTETTVKHPMKLLEFLKGSSKPRTRMFSESHTVNLKRKNTKNEFGARVMSSEDPVVVAGKTSRGARFFSSASSLFSGLMPAVTPPSVRGGRAACAGPCHVNPMADLAVLAAEMVPVQVSNATRRFPSIRRRPQTAKSVTSTTTTEAPALTTSTIRAPLSRFSTRRRIEPSTTTTTTTVAPVEEQVVTTSTTEPEIITTRNPRLFMFRKFKILQRSSTPDTTNFEN